MSPHGCLTASLVGCAFFFFFFNDTATTEIYTLSLHDALPISVFEMDDISTRRERPRRRGADGAAIAPRSPEPPRAPENLVIRQDAQHRQNESAVEGADRQGRPIGAEQLFEPLELAFVVAQNDGGGRLRDDGAQTLDVAVDMLGW